MDPKIKKPFTDKFPITFRFGEGPDWYIKKFGYPHNGVDFAMPDGTEIKAAASGTVVYADMIPDSDGQGVNILHKGWLTQYWHLSKVTAKIGQEIKQGELLGLSGHSGFATGPHLHFGLKIIKDSLENMRGWKDPILYMEEKLESPLTPLPQNRVYIVRSGDTLWGVSIKCYGSGIYWRRIYEANKGKIEDPNLIHPWQVLRIP
jgi:murein DD-endopeptidase MepM/ murein hydrolase activator NlpD